MKFNSQIATSLVQSERLLALGLKKETADMAWLRGHKKPVVLSNTFNDKEYGCIPAWSLHRLIEMKQPNTIDNAVVVLSREQTYDKLIGMIAKSIKEGKFPKKYLEE